MKPGKWIYDKHGMDWNIGAWRCSVCGGRNNNIGGNDKINPLIFAGSNFCPHCGADMTGKGIETFQTETGGDKMEKLDTVQQLGKLNDVYRVGEPGPGGAYHDYAVSTAEREKGVNPIVAMVRFQKGPRSAPNARTGVLDVDLIEIVRDRLKAFQKGEYACQENAQALGYLEAALMAMNARVENRIERGVLGTDKK